MSYVQGLGHGVFLMYVLCTLQQQWVFNCFLGMKLQMRMWGKYDIGEVLLTRPGINVA